MADPTNPETELALRRLALEERQADDAFRLREKELEIEALKARSAGTGQSDEHRSKLSMAAISVVSALVGAAASLGAAFFSGHFSVQEKTVETEAAADLEQQKFSYELITTALAEPDQIARALRLQFMVDIGLLRDLNQDEIRRYARAEQARIESGDGGYSLLPETRAPVSLDVANIQRELGLLADGIAGPMTAGAVAARFEGFEGDTGSAMKLLRWHPTVLLGWIRAGSLPPDWRAQLEALEAARLGAAGAAGAVGGPAIGAAAAPDDAAAN